MNPWRFGAVLAGVTLWVSVQRPALAAETCVVGSGQAIVLSSSELDPDVFVWDGRQRATDYAGGVYKTARDVMDHTLISKPGTRAIVVTCIHRGAQEKFTRQAVDVVGLRIVSGPDRGRYGWVTADDVHVPLPPSSTAVKGVRPAPPP